MIDIDVVVTRFKKELEVNRIEKERKTIGAQIEQVEGRAAGEQWAATKASYKVLRELSHWHSGMCLPRLGPTTSHDVEQTGRNIKTLLETICPNKPSVAYRQGFIEGALEVYEQARAIIGQEES